MTHDRQPDPLQRLRERYSDLLGPGTADSDPTLARLVADLDALHSAEPPAALLSAFATGAFSERTARRRVLDLSVVAPARRAERHPQGATLMPTRRRLPALVGSLAAVLVVGLMAVLLISMSHGGGIGSGNPHETPAQRFARLGGTRLVLQTQACPGSASYATDCYVQAFQARMVAAEQQRASTFLNVHDAIVQALPNTQILIELPGYRVRPQDLLAFTTTGAFAVVDTSVILPAGSDISDKLCPAGAHCPSGSYHVVFTGDQLAPSSISAGYDSNSSQPIVTFAFAGAARGQFATYTSSHINQPLTLTLDGVVVESAIIQSAISGAGQITGIPTIQQAQAIAALLRVGALPVSATLVSIAIVPPAGACQTPTPAPIGTATPTATTGPIGTATPMPSATPTPAAAGLRPPLFSGGPTPTTPPGPTPPPTPTPGPFDGTPSPTVTDPCSTPTPTATPGQLPGTPTPTPPATQSPPTPPPTPPPTATPKR